MYGVAFKIASVLGINVFRLAVYASLAASVAGGAVALKYHYINVGHKQAVDEIAADVKETLHAVQEKAAEVDACRSAHRVWSTVDGVCD